MEVDESSMSLSYQVDSEQVSSKILALNLNAGNVNWLVLDGQQDFPSAGRILPSDERNKGTAQRKAKERNSMYQEEERRNMKTRKQDSNANGHVCQ